MKFSLASVAAVLMATQAQAVTLSYDQGYDQGSRSLTATSCSDGEHGLITRFHWNTQSQVPHFPLVGGSPDIAGWNSPSCGQCYKLTYQGRSIFLTAIDHSAPGTFNVALGAMGKLLPGGTTEAKQKGRITLSGVQKVASKNCGF